MSIWIIATILAFFIKGLCGFANTLVFSTILSFQTNNINISPIDLIIGYFPNMIMSYKERKHIQLKICIPLIILILLGNIPGIFLLKNADVQIIKLLFGFVIIGIGIEMLLQNNKKTSPLILTCIGLLSGFLCGLYGIGALLAAYVSKITNDTQSFKGNICFVFTLENTFRILIYSYLGILTIHSIYQALSLIPFMLIGLFLGIKCSQYINEQTTKRIVIIMLMISGLALIINNI